MTLSIDGKQVKANQIYLTNGGNYVLTIGHDDENLHYLAYDNDYEQFITYKLHQVNCLCRLVKDNATLEYFYILTK